MAETGDCEDDVILAAAVLKRPGFDVALLYHPGHVALDVAGAGGLPGEYVSILDGKKTLKYFYGETTAEDWLLGEVPKHYHEQKPSVVEKIRRLVVA